MKEKLIKFLRAFTEWLESYPFEKEDSFYFSEIENGNNGSIFRIDYEKLYVNKKGWIPSDIKSHSYFNTPIPESDFLNLHGNSRRWGDVNKRVQKKVIDTLISVCKEYGIKDYDLIRIIVAIARVESGFNPDAAAGSSSAAGVGQFIRKTGEHYGLNDSNRFDIEAGCRALVAHCLDNFARAERAGYSGDKLYLAIYKLHHEGSFTNDFGGWKLANGVVNNWFDICKSAITVRDNE